MSVNRTPKTFVAGEVVSATHLNDEVRDLSVGLQASWDSYTPTWLATGTAPAKGNGVTTGRYLRIGNTVFFRARLTTGSTSTYGTGVYGLSLPVAAEASLSPRLFAMLFDASASATYLATAYNVSGTATSIAHPSTNGLLVATSPTAPFTWATGDILDVYGTYEAA